MDEIVLYELDGCPYCAKVINKLEELEIEYKSVMVPHQHSERTEVKEVSDQTSVPVIVDPNNGVDGMSESDDIVAYLDRQYGDNQD